MEERLLAILRLALNYEASDIHFKQKYNEISIDMRIGGSFYKVKAKLGDEKLLRYLQYLARIDMGKLTTPQTGQFEMEVDGTLLSLRFAIINDVNTSDGVLRILNSNLKIEADNLSIISEQNAYFKSLLRHDTGLVIFTGPTGSGKTTTLYSLLKSVKNKKIYTIEDPIEVYHDDFIQIEINEAAGINYEEGLKQILRHDPDIIMVGEIRDKKAAISAVNAANTGHLVLTTLHTSSSASTISRMVELGVNESYLYENLLCISHQRMMVRNDNKKLVLYEVMNEEEINYYRKYGIHRDNFLSLNKQIKEGINNGLIKENS